MGRLAVLIVFLACLRAPGLSAQVIECPGLLPSSDIGKTRVTTLAKQLFSRFVAILDLQDVEAVDEGTVIAMYSDHPEQIAIKLSYLALQCQIVVLDSRMTRPERRKAVRRVFLDYVLMPPNTEAESLADYINDIATMNHDSALSPSIAAVELALTQVPRRQWQERWFPSDTASTADLSGNTNRWSVIISSPRYEDEGWAELKRHQQRWPDVYFELDGPYDLESPFFAVVAGRTLPAASADELLELIRSMGMAKDAFRWKVPGNAEQASSPKKKIDFKLDQIQPTPPRPTTLDGQALSQ